MQQSTPYSHLTPLTIGQILDRGFRLLPAMVRCLWLPCLFVALFAPLLLYGESKWNLIERILLNLLAAFVYICILPLITFVSEEVWLTGTGSLARARERYSFSFVLESLVMWLWTILLIVIGFLLFVIPGFVYAANRFLSYYILVLEGQGIEHALRRSKLLMTKGRWYSLHAPLARLSGLGLVTIMIGLSGVLLSGAGAIVAMQASDSVWIWLVAFLASFVGTFLYYLLSLFTMTVYVGFYYDLRVRYEGIDLLHEPTISSSSTPS